MDKDTSKRLGSNVRDGIQEDESREITHGIQKVRLATVVGEITGCPEIQVQNVERAAEWPGENQFTVARDGTVRCDAMWAREHPRGDVLAAAWPKES